VLVSALQSCNGQDKLWVPPIQHFLRRFIGDNGVSLLMSSGLMMLYRFTVMASGMRRMF
jgi:hypothetical protein